MLRLYVSCPRYMLFLRLEGFLSRGPGKANRTEQSGEAERTRRKVCLRVHFKSHTCGETYCFIHFARSMILEKSCLGEKRFSFAFIYAIFDFLPFSLRKPEIWSNMSCWHLRVYVSVCMYVGIETPIKIMLSTPYSSAYTKFCHPYLHDLSCAFLFL